TAAMPSVAAVRVDDDLASGETGVAHRSADRERAGPVHQVLRLRVEPRADDGRPYDLLADLVAETLVIDAGVVLRRDDDGVHALGDALGVLDGHLGLPVGSQIRKRAVLASLRELPRDGVSERDAEWHQLRGLEPREPAHHSL